MTQRRHRKEAFEVRVCHSEPRGSKSRAHDGLFIGCVECPFGWAEASGIYTKSAPETYTQAGWHRCQEGSFPQGHIPTGRNDGDLVLVGQTAASRSAVPTAHAVRKLKNRSIGRIVRRRPFASGLGFGKSGDTQGISGLVDWLNESGESKLVGAQMMNLHSEKIGKALNAIEAKDDSTAFILLNELADQGNPKAQSNLANFYHFGWGTPADGIKAAQLYEAVGILGIAEERLSAPAYHNLSVLYAVGAPGLRPDSDKARKYGRFAKESGFDM